MNNDTSTQTAPTSESPSQTTPSGTTSVPNEAQVQASASETMQRAEVAVDQAGEAIGRAVAGAGHAALRFFARAREGAEDMWAEAQHLRAGSGLTGEANGSAPASTPPEATISGEGTSTSEAQTVTPDPAPKS